MVDVARKTARVVQTGSQQRSDDRFRLAAELALNGKLGKIKTVLVGIPKPNFAQSRVPDGDPPAELNYDMWLGPAQFHAYNTNRVHYNFRFFWDYSGGQMTNFGAHHLDIAHRARQTTAARLPSKAPPPSRRTRIPVRSTTPAALPTRKRTA